MKIAKGLFAAALALVPVGCAERLVCEQGNLQKEEPQFTAFYKTGIEGKKGREFELDSLGNPFGFVSREELDNIDVVTQARVEERARVL